MPNREEKSNYLLCFFVKETGIFYGFCFIQFATVVYFKEFYFIFFKNIRSAFIRRECSVFA